MNGIWHKDVRTTQVSPENKVTAFFYSFLSGVDYLVLSWILQVAAPHLLKNCLVGWKFFSFNPGNGGIITFTNDTKGHKVKILKAMSLDMEMIQIPIFVLILWFLVFLTSPLAEQPATYVVIIA